jgi:hypothetical protein
MIGIGDIMDYGAIGDGVTSDSDAFEACLNANQVCYLPPGKHFAIDKTLHIEAQKAIWCPGASWATIVVKFSGLAIEMSGVHPGLYGVGIVPYAPPQPTDQDFSGSYDGVGFRATDLPILHDVLIRSPRTGLLLVSGECDWGDIQVSIKEFHCAGIDFSDPNCEPVPTTVSGNNVIRILEEINGRQSEHDQNWPSGDTYGIRMHGSANTIIGGEIAFAKYAIDDQGTQNRWIGQFVEDCRSIKVGPGAHYFDCHLFLDAPPIIDSESVVFGQSGLTYTQYCHFERPQASASNLMGLWYFDEDVNGVIMDHSGHGNHLALSKFHTAIGPNLFVESPYGKALVLPDADVSESPGNPPFLHNPTIPIAVCDWTKPFTIVMCFQLEQNEFKKGGSVISWERAGAYTRIIPGLAIRQLQDSTPGKPFGCASWSAEVIASADDDPSSVSTWCWLGMYIDPVGGKVKLLDSWVRSPEPKNCETGKSLSGERQMDIVGGLVNPESIQLFFSSALGHARGAICFLAFWQRELMLPEFIALINQRTHWRPTPRSEVAMKKLELLGADGEGRRISYDAAQPSRGDWRQGDIVYNAIPAAGGRVGWVCVGSGSPGTWKPFGAIDS